MRWSKSLRLSAQALTRAPIRTLLAASGIAIGLAALMLLLALGSGAERQLEEALEQMGENLLAIGSERRTTDALRGSIRYQTLTIADGEAIAAGIRSAQLVAPIVLGLSVARFGGDSSPTTVIGTTPAFEHTNNPRLVEGRFLEGSDVRDRRRVAVLGAQVARTLFHGELPLGERILLGRSPFVVVGVLEEKGVDPTGAPQDDRVLVPISTAQRRLLDTDSVDRIFVQVRSRDEIADTVAAVRRLLRTRHRLDDAARPDDFSITDQTALLATLSDNDRSLRRFLRGTSTLVLAMAGLGLYAISQLSVAERTGEIGLRRAVGGLRRHILLQFLGESAMIACLGAGIGLVLGGLGAGFARWGLGWTATLDAGDVGLTVLAALALAVVFGAVPAWRAARLDPIAALQSE